jgi:Tol biopolymer transport system component
VINDLPQLNFLTHNPAYNDYRPAVGPDGGTVIFERTPVFKRTQTIASATVLFKLVLPSSEKVGGAQPTPFLSGAAAPVMQTRPDWCWPNACIAFNGAAANNTPVSVWVVSENGMDAEAVPYTDGYFYPSWSRDGHSLVTESSSREHAPNPRNTIFDRNGTVVERNIDGEDANGTAVFGGMPTVGPGDLPQIAFAGQPALSHWNAADGAAPSYNQNSNYIFLNDFQNGAFTSAPMESLASITTYDPRYQGRAPAWSPDGRTIAFESNRSGKGYAIYLYSLDNGSVTQVTDPEFGAQHAKFFPCGSRLILCAYPPGRTPRAGCIAWVDISGLLNT